MRFFSNEAKDDADTQTETAVPQQRSGSPWQHPEPGNPGAGTGTAPVRPASSTEDDDPNRTVAFNDGTPRTEPVQVNPAPSTSDFTDSSDLSGKSKDDVDLALDEHDTGDDPHATQPLRTGAGESRHAVDKPESFDSDSRTSDPVDSTSVDKDAALDEDASFDAGKDSAGSDVVVVPDEPADKDTDRSEASDTTEPLVTPAPAAESTISGPAPFFPASDTQPLRDRWRDVQLRFVDDPKGATTEASGLVDDAVDKLASALRDHRSSFAKGTDDTEALRVEFRSYRDILDRLLGL